MASFLHVSAFLAHKHLLLTGVTGFLAKVLLEKILRLQSQVGKVFCLVRAKDEEEAQSRMNKVFATDLFNKLREIHGSHFSSFISEKVGILLGDLSQLNLGLKTPIAQHLMQSLHVIINCSATTAFDERYDTALDINTIAPHRIVTLAKQCTHLQVFLHVSTAYVNGKKAGTVKERALQMGDITNAGSNTSTDTDIFPDLDVEVEIKKLKEAIEHFNKQALGNGDQLAQFLKDLGKERARFYGWQDTYAFTKAMGEMMINRSRADLPVVILRPTIIESTIADPFPGWIEGNRVIDKVLVLYGKGHLTSFPVAEKLILDVVPADMVVNCMLAAMTKHSKQAGIHIYHMSSSTSNPVMGSTIADIASHSFISKPHVNNAGKVVKVDRLHLINSMYGFKRFLVLHCFLPFLVLGLFHWLKGSPNAYKEIKLIVKGFKRILYLVEQYEPYVFFHGRFDNSNTQALLKELSNEERNLLPFDVKEINWVHYFGNVHLPNLRKYIMKESGKND